MSYSAHNYNQKNATKSFSPFQTDVLKEERDESATLNICLKNVSDENRTTADQRSDFSGLNVPSDTDADVIRKLETECDNDDISDCSEDESSTEDESSVTSCSSSSSSSSTLVTVKNCDIMMVK